MVKTLSSPCDTIRFFIADCQLPIGDFPLKQSCLQAGVEDRQWQLEIGNEPNECSKTCDF